MKNFDISRVGQLEFGTEETESLSFYLKLAEITIQSYGNKYKKLLLNSEDAIQYVANCLIIGDTKWKPEKGMSKKSWRIQQGIFAISKFMRRLRKEKQTESLFQNDSAIDYRDPATQVVQQEDSENVLYSLYNSGLSANEANIIKMYLWDNMTFKQIGEEYKVSKQRAKQRYDAAINKLGDIWNKKN